MLRRLSVGIAILALCLLVIGAVSSVRQPTMNMMKVLGWQTVFLISAFCCAVIGWGIGTRKGYSGLGFLLGLVLGPVGIVIISATLSTVRRCRHCQSVIVRGVAVCSRCGRDVPVQAEQTETGRRAAP